MRELLLIIFIINTFHISTNAQNNDRWNAGSGKKLTGSVVSLICFISTPEENWTDTEKKNAVTEIAESESWLIEQAKQYNADVSFKHSIINDGKDLKFSTIEPGKASGNERVDWIYRTIIKLGYKNSKQAYKKLKRSYKADNIHVILMAKGKGRSYSMRYAKGFNKKKYMLEGMINYHMYLNSAPVPIAAVTSHELLHLYGAWDLYTTYAQTSDRQQKATELYPNDIMLRVDHNLNSLEINNLTAWLIGWNHEKEDLFEWFRPTDFRK